MEVMITAEDQIKSNIQLKKLLQTFELKFEQFCFHCSIGKRLKSALRLQFCSKAFYTVSGKQKLPRFIKKCKNFKSDEEMFIVKSLGQIFQGIPKRTERVRALRALEYFICSKPQLLQQLPRPYKNICGLWPPYSKNLKPGFLFPRHKRR